MNTVRKRLASSGRFIFVLIILVSAFVFAMFQGGQVSWTIFYAILPFTLYATALFFYPLSDFVGERTIRTNTVQKNGKLIVELSVRRKWRFPLLYTVVTEKWRDEEQSKFTALVVFGIRKEMKWTYEVEHMPRGEHVIEGIQIELSDFFGWIRKTSFIPIQNTVLILPNTTSINYSPSGKRYEGGSISSPFNIVKDTTLATGVRDYESGDRISWIHWKSYARTQTLMTKEFEDGRSQELFVVLDDRVSEEFEEKVELTATILKVAVEQKTTVGFMSLGEEKVVFPSIQSAQDFHDVLVHLAKIKQAEDTPLLLQRTFGHLLRKGEQIILVTSSPDQELIKSISRRAKTMSSFVLFAVMKEEASEQRHFIQDVDFARMKGITVHVLRQKGLSKEFSEVSIHG